MAHTFQNSQIKPSVQGQQRLSNNGLAFSGKPGQAKRSFANEMAAVREASVQGEQGQKLLNENPKFISQKPEKSQSESITNPVFANALNESLSGQMKSKLKELRDKEITKEKQLSQNFEEGKKDAEELSQRFTSSESEKAQAAQVNNKQVTEAAREGNMAQEQAQHQDANDRKQQLANWDELAPRIIEDPMNRAVRIDIPGINDVETLIVRMKQGGVAIQVVGDKVTMEKLQSNESHLARALGEHDVKLGSLQAFDAKSIKTKG